MKINFLQCLNPSSNKRSQNKVNVTNINSSSNIDIIKCTLFVEVFAHIQFHAQGEFINKYFLQTVYLFPADRHGIFCFGIFIVVIGKKRKKGTDL